VPCSKRGGRCGPLRPGRNLDQRAEVFRIAAGGPRRFQALRPRRRRACKTPWPGSPPRLLWRTRFSARDRRCGSRRSSTMRNGLGRFPATTSPRGFTPCASSGPARKARPAAASHAPGRVFTSPTTVRRRANQRVKAARQPAPRSTSRRLTAASRVRSPRPETNPLTSSIKHLQTNPRPLESWRSPRRLRNRRRGRVHSSGPPGPSSSRT